MSEVGFTGVANFAMTSTATAVRAMGVSGVGGGIAAAVGPSLTLSFVSSPTGYPVLDPRITFTRSTTATRTNESGLIESVAINAPRFNYNPTTLAAQGLLIEEQRVNLLVRSEEFDNASWVKTAATITANAVVSPDGTVDADKLVEDTANSTHSVSTALFSFTSGTSYTLSLFVKAAERTAFDISRSGPGGASASFNLTTLTATAIAGTPTMTIVAVGNDWYRCTMSWSASATANRTHAIQLNNPAGTSTYTGNGTSGIYIWGAQLEAGAFSTSYIPTVASQVTRAADVAVMTGTNFSSWYNQTEGTLFFEARATWTLPVNGVLISVNDGTSANRIRTFLRSTITSPANRLSIYVSNNSATTANIGDLGLPISQTNSKICYAYQGTSLVGTKDGAPVTTGTSGAIPTFTQFSIGSDVNGSNAFCGTIASIVYYPIQLSNASDQGLSS